MELKALKCTCCCGRINRKTMKCEYCGTEYIIKDDNIIRIETFTNPIKDVEAQMLVSRELVERVGGQELMEVCVKRLANELAEQFYDAMQVRGEHIPELDQYKIQARMKVVIPVMKREERMRPW